jgi:hypothetical protein
MKEFSGFGSWMVSPRMTLDGLTAHGIVMAS